jgi:hypothetical protein
MCGFWAGADDAAGNSLVDEAAQDVAPVASQPSQTSDFVEEVALSDAVMQDAQGPAAAAAGVGNQRQPEPADRVQRRAVPRTGVSQLYNLAHSPAPTIQGDGDDSGGPDSDGILAAQRLRPEQAALVPILNKLHISDVNRLLRLIHEGKLTPQCIPWKNAADVRAVLDQDWVSFFWQQWHDCITHGQTAFMCCIIIVVAYCVQTAPASFMLFQGFKPQGVLYEHIKSVCAGICNRDRPGKA